MVILLCFLVLSIGGIAFFFKSHLKKLKITSKYEHNSLIIIAFQRIA